MLNPDKKRSAGFTLVELIIVVMIIGIAAAVAAPRYADALSHYRAEAAAKRIEVDLNLAQRRASISSAAQSIQFDVASDSYVLPGVPHLDHPDLDYKVELAKPPCTASIVSADFGGNAELIFDGYGAADSGGTVVVQSGKYQKTITVDADTGKATIE